MLTDRQLNQAFRYCVALTGNRDDAYDLLQDGMVKYLERRPTEISHPLAYLRALLRNLFVDRYRAHRPTVALKESEGDLIAYDGTDLESLTITGELTQTIMSRLDSRDRELLFLWAVEGFTIGEISEMTQRPRGTLLSRLHRIRKRIQKEHQQLDQEVSQ